MSFVGKVLKSWVWRLLNTEVMLRNEDNTESIFTAQNVRSWIPQTWNKRIIPKLWQEGTKFCTAL